MFYSLEAVAQIAQQSPQASSLQKDRVVRVVFSHQSGQRVIMDEEFQ